MKSDKIAFADYALNRVPFEDLAAMHRFVIIAM
jgi:hypothetical protein